MSKTILYNSKKSVSNANWKIIVLDDFTRRFVDYLSQKYNLPNYKNGFFIDKNNLSSLTLPSFTKKLLNSIKKN